jgi:hypothetical protein
MRRQLILGVLQKMTVECYVEDMYYYASITCDYTILCDCEFLKMRLFLNPKLWFPGLK